MKTSPKTSPFVPPDPVLIVTPWYLESLGGVAVVAERLRVGLSKKGVPTRLLVAQGRPRFCEVKGMPEVWRYGVPSTYFGVASLKSLLGNILRAPLALWRLSRFLRAQQIRTVILIYPIAFTWPFLVLRRPVGLRLVTSLHGNDVERFGAYSAPMKSLLRTVLRTSDVVVACAPHLIETSRRIVGDASLSAAVIPNGVDLNHFTPAPPERRRRTGSPHFVHVSNFASKKRTHEIVEAFANADLPPHAHLTMVGDGPCLQGTRERALELDLEGRVTFPGRKEDVRPFFWDADAFVLASDSEGAPLVLLEAMACGVPFISTPWGAASDIPSGECGLTVPIGDREALAEAMTGLIRNPEERQRMASRARQLAEERYSIEAYIERHLEVLR